MLKLLALSKKQIENGQSYSVSEAIQRACESVKVKN
jgi:hypothetical protein